MKNSSLAFSYPPCSILSFRNCLIATSTLPCHLPWANIILIDVRTYNTFIIWYFVYAHFPKTKYYLLIQFRNFPGPAQYPCLAQFLEYPTFHQPLRSRYSIGALCILLWANMLILFDVLFYTLLLILVSFQTCDYNGNKRS